MDGQRHRAPADTLLAVLRAMGEPAHRPEDAPEILRRRRHQRRQRIVEPTLVAWDGALPGPVLRLPRKAAPASVRLEFTGERGEQRGLTCADLLIADDPDFDDRIRVRPAQRVQLDPGVWELVADAGGQVSRATVIAAPSRLEPRHGSLGVFLPLHAACGAEDRGCGNLTDLGRLMRWAGGIGCDHFGVLPLLPTFLEDPPEPSPYAAITRMLPGELFADPARGPWEAPGRRLRAAMEELQPGALGARGGRYVDYRQVWATQFKLLLAVAEDVRASGSLREDLDRFKAANPLAVEYAAFRARGRRLGRDFFQWPADRPPGPEEQIDAEALLCGQWLAAAQLERLEAEGRSHGCRLYADWPIGIHRHSFDVWRYPALFAREMSVGAPPDDFSTSGQNWGFPPILPEQSRADGHAYFRGAIAEHLRAAGTLRIDHVMGLHRLLWIPSGASAVDGAYVRYPTDELYACIMLEASRRGATIIGENLGVVPAEVNATLRRRGFLSMRVAQFEQGPGEPAPLRRGEAAMVNTHDTPTFAGFVLGADIELALQLGRIDAESAGRQFSARADAIARLRQRLGVSPESGPRELLMAMLRQMSASEASSALVSLEDLWAEPEPQNTPGTTDQERPNWRRRAARSIMEIESDESLAAELRELTQLRASGPSE
ncbi:MAG: 4-alpha-glucanotransferase [Phycisphaerales bacterium JB039]